MAIDTIGAFRLTIWRPLAHSRPISVEPIEATGEPTVLGIESVHEAIYEWQPKIDVWGSLPGSDVTNELREQLRRFHPFEPRSERAIEHLRPFLEKLEEILSSDSGKWAFCTTQADETGEPEVEFRSNTALALYRNMKWVYEIFRDLPGAVVTIR
jgi:hypothetical protein